ncbi:MAG TPA: alpha/beta fold hydrolase, partial [Pirellulales bacterium]|nr:alpha/beta fold hydrolase [Pirellulales bacterium]
MRRLLLASCLMVGCLIAGSLAPAQAQAGWLADAWQSTKQGAAYCTEKVKDFTAAQGARISQATNRARAWVRGKAADCTPEDRRRNYGLQLAAPLDDSKRLVVLVHGLDSGPELWSDLSELLVREGHQVAAFDFPNDQPIAESGALLASQIQPLREARPQLRVDLLTHSMGGLVARSFVESPAYAGGIDRLILLAPPNQGSKYARWNCFSEIAEHYSLWRNDPNWHWTWPFVDGVGEAGRDLQPGSVFLSELNARPRSAGVRYTIIAGNRNCGWRYCAASLQFVAGYIPDWRIEADDELRDGLTNLAARLRERPSATDGLVRVSNV